MPVFSTPKHNPLIHYYTNPKNSQDTEILNNKNRHIRNSLDEEVYAKKIISHDSLISLSSNQVTKHKYEMEFFIRLSPNRKTVFDTREKYCIAENTPDFITRTCKNTGAFIKVSSQVFEKYLDFLEIESESLFKECNRLINRL